MGRQFSSDPEKRRLQLFRNIFINYHKWRSDVERHHIHYLTIEGEEIYFYDLMVGIDDLPARQREAFELHILMGMPEKEAAWHMGFMRHEEVEKIVDGETVSETVTVGWFALVGQYSTAALRRMVASYDALNVHPELDAVSQ